MSFEIKKGTQALGTFADVNPVVINSDEECLSVLKTITDKIGNFSEEEKTILDICVETAKAAVEDDIKYGPNEMLGLANMAMAHPDLANELTAVMEFLTQSVENEVDADTLGDYFSNMFLAHLSLSKPLARDPKKLDDPESESEDEEEEPVSDDE